MMIWLGSFIISNYKLASGPPKDPGGSKKILSKSKDMIHRIVSVKNKLSNPFPNEWLKYFQSLCFICHMIFCIFLPTNRKNRDEWYDMMGHGFWEVHITVQILMTMIREVVKKRVFYGQADRKEGWGVNPLGPDSKEMWNFWPINGA